MAIAVGSNSSDFPLPVLFLFPRYISLHLILFFVFFHATLRDLPGSLFPLPQRIRIHSRGPRTTTCLRVVQDVIVNEAVAGVHLPRILALQMDVGTPLRASREGERCHVKAWEALRAVVDVVRAVAAGLPVDE